MSDYLAYQPDFNEPEIVAAYDELPFWSALFGRLLFKNLPLYRGQTVLDLGYGTGFPLFELAEQLGTSCTVYGIDPWDTARQRALAKARVWQVSNVHILPGDAAALHFPDGMFDLIVSNLGLNNFADPAASLRECVRVAKPGARLALTTNLQGHMHEFYEVFELTLEETGHSNLISALHEHIAHRATIERVQALLEQAGFHPTTTHQETETLRYLDGSAFLRHHLIKQGFLDAWKGLLAPADQPAAFAKLEANLNRLAEERGELSMTIPMAYLEAEK